MKIGIYNRYWNTRGGGERYAGVIAEILAQRYPVELLGPEQVDLEGLANHLGLQIGALDFRKIPPVRERDLAMMTADYDLLINCTYLSRMPSYARKSVYLVLFPQSTWPSWLVRAARLCTDFLHPGASQVLPIEGFHPVDGSGSHWSGEGGRVVVRPEAFNQGTARIRFAPSTPWSLKEAFEEVHVEGGEWQVEGDDLVLHHPQWDTGEPRTLGPVEFSFRCRTFVPVEDGISADSRRLGVCLTEPTGRRHGRLRWLADRMRGYIDGHDAAIPVSYDLLISISEFTREWVERRWNAPSVILEPPVDTTTFTAPEPEGKKKVILSVGRFFQGSHNKKHLEMLKVFRTMHDQGRIPAGWEYHMVGNLHRAQLKHLEYFAELERLAEGYPVKLLTDMQFDQLIREYREAAIFWHASGWGENERRNPEKFEHFGITTCEAMSAGCIPVVIAKAGQLEIVEHGKSGFLFHDAAELSAQTQRLMEEYGEPWTLELMHQAKESVQRFSRTQFEERLWEILDSEGMLRL